MSLRTFFYILIILSRVSFSQEFSKPENEIKKFNMKSDVLFSTDFVLDSADYLSNNIFLSGEYHNESINTKLQLELFKHFYHHGIRILLLELDVKLEKRINDFLLIGDKSLLKGFNREYKKYFIKLREFYVSIPNDDKFRVRNIDISCGYYDYYNGLYQLFPEKELPPEDIREIYLSIEYYKDNGSFLNPYKIDDKPKEFKFEISTSLLQYDSIYKEYLAEDYDYFRRIVESDICGCSVKSGLNKITMEDSSRLRVREFYFQQDIEKLIMDSPEVKAFGQFGNIHIRKSQVKSNSPFLPNFKSLSMHLTENDTNQINVCSIYYY